MSISNLFDIITQPMMNRTFPGLSDDNSTSPGTSFADFLNTADSAGPWAEITGLRLSDSINSALLELQEQGDISDVRDLWDEMSAGKSLDDMLMKKPEYVYASISASITYGSFSDSFNFGGSSGSDSEYDMIFGSSSWRIESLMKRFTSSGNSKSGADQYEIMQMNMMYKFRQLMP